MYDTYDQHLWHIDFLSVFGTMFVGAYEFNTDLTWKATLLFFDLHGTIYIDFGGLWCCFDS